MREEEMLGLLRWMEQPMWFAGPPESARLRSLGDDFGCLLLRAYTRDELRDADRASRILLALSLGLAAFDHEHPAGLRSPDLPAASAYLLEILTPALPESQRIRAAELAIRYSAILAARRPKLSGRH